MYKMNQSVLSFHNEYIIPNSPSRPYTGGKVVLQSTTEKRHVSGSTVPNNCLHFHSVCCYWCWADWQKWQSRLKGCVSAQLIIPLKKVFTLLSTLMKMSKKQKVLNILIMNWFLFFRSSVNGECVCACAQAHHFQFQVSLKVSILQYVLYRDIKDFWDFKLGETPNALCNLQIFIIHTHEFWMTCSPWIIDL